MRADLLAEPVAGLDEALAAVDAFNQVLVAGLLRPQPAQAAGLARLAQAVAGTPLASRVAEAAEKAAAGVAGEDHFTVLAAARTALLGSVHDALRAQVAEATGRPQGHDDCIAPSGQPATGLKSRRPLLAVRPGPLGLAGARTATWSPDRRRSCRRCCPIKRCGGWLRCSTASRPSSARPAPARPPRASRCAAGPTCGRGRCC